MGVGYVVLPFVLFGVVVSLGYVFWAIYAKRYKTVSFFLTIGYLCSMLICQVELNIELRALKTLLLADDEGWLSQRAESNIFFLGLLLFTLFVAVNLPWLLKKIASVLRAK